jgi:mRNA interferase MazF
VIHRGDLHWADLGPRSGSRPAKRRPVVIVSADAFNASRLATVLTVAVTSNTSLAARPGNVFLPATATGLPRDSVANVTAILTLNKTDLEARSGSVPHELMQRIDRGLLRVLGLSQRV